MLKQFRCRDDPLTCTRRVGVCTWRVGESFPSYFHGKLQLLNQIPIISDRGLSEQTGIEYVIEGI